MNHRYAPLFVLTALVVAVLIVLMVAADASSANKHQIRSTICSVFTGVRCGPAIRVATCETGGTLDPNSRGAAGERGLFQIHPVHFGWLDERRLYEPLFNARIAYRLSRGGTNWRPWTCRWAA